MTLVEQDTQPDLSGMDLPALARFANAEHSQANAEAGEASRHLTQAVYHGIRAGEALLAAKALHGHAGWEAWMVENVDITPTRGRRYIRWAYYKDTLLSAETPLTAKTADDFLKGLPSLPGSGWHPPSGHAPEIKALLAKGLTAPAIAEMLEVNISTVYYHDDRTGRRGTQRKRARRKHSEDRAAQRALARERKNEAAKAVGGDLSKAYSLVRQLAAVLDSAMGDAESGRDDLRMGLAAAHKAEDHISAAIRKATS